MPQMSPMWWTMLMMLFTINTALFFMSLYFQYSPKMSFKVGKKQSKMIWKW